LESITLYNSERSSASSSRSFHALYVWLIILAVFISTRANVIALSDITLALYIALTLVVFVFSGKKIHREFLWLNVVFVGIAGIHFLKFGKELEWHKYFKLLLIYNASGMLCSMIGAQLFPTLIKIGRMLVLLSLPFYAAQLIDIGSIQKIGFSINTLFQGLLEARSEVNDQSVNILFHNIEFAEPWRNAGVFWEPGGFGYFLSLCIILELATPNRKNNTTLLILLLGVVSTFSTTAYLITAVSLFSNGVVQAASSSNYKLKLAQLLLVGGFVVAGVVSFFSSEMFYGKISNEIESQLGFLENQPSALNQVKSLGRFGSLVLDMQYIQESPWIGIGHSNNRFADEYPSYIFTNGLSALTRSFGLIGLALMLFMTYVSAKKIKASLFSPWPLVTILLIAIVFISFSNPVLFSPVPLLFQTFFCFQLNQKNGI
jgi:hypothetical protein